MSQHHITDTFLMTFINMPAPNVSTERFLEA